MNRSRSDRQAVPGIDHSDHDREVRQLLFGELTPYCFVDLIGRMRRGDICECFRPDQGRTLVLRIEMRLSPGIEQMHAQVGFTVFARLFSVHVETIGTAVDLRDSDLHQGDKPLIEPASLQVLLNAKQSRDPSGIVVNGFSRWAMTCFPSCSGSSNSVRVARKLRSDRSVIVSRSTD